MSCQSSETSSDRRNAPANPTSSSARSRNPISVPGSASTIAFSSSTSTGFLPSAAVPLRGTAAEGKKPVLVDELKAMVDALPGTLIGLRDRALLLVGFAGAFRRSELVSLDWHDIEFQKEGLTITLRRSKTDQEGQGRKVGIPYGRQSSHCPVRALE